jgi:hypothetical protein
MELGFAHFDVVLDCFECGNELLVVLAEECGCECGRDYVPVCRELLEEDIEKFWIDWVFLPIDGVSFCLEKILLI